MIFGVRCRLVRAPLFNCLDESDRASDVAEDEKTFIVIQYLIVVGETLVVSDTIERFHDGDR